jgi:surface polysaccharide O-acyltransferase-like enzyme
MDRIKLLAVLVAAAINFVLGGIWYGLLFGGMYIKLIGPEKLKEMQNESVGGLYVLEFVGSLVLAYVLAYFVRHAKSALKGARLGFLAALGFVLTTSFETVLFEKRVLGLYLINNGYHLVGFVIMGMLLAVWRKHETDGVSDSRRNNSFGTNR